MSTLYIDRKDIELRINRGVLEFRGLKGRCGSVPLAQLERVVLRGRAQLSTSVLGAIVEAGAGILILSGRHNRQLAICVGRPHNDVLRRIGQLDAFGDREGRARWARELIAAKTKAQLRLLSKAVDGRPDKRRPLTHAAKQLESAYGQLTSSASPPKIGSVLGIEGSAAKAYFSAYSELFPPSLGFKGRRRRPPTDPVNACLSLGYTLLHFEAVIACHAAGLDPLLGLYHEPAYGRESLASDAIEPFRSHVDEWVWKLFRERTLKEQGFRKDNGAVLLGKAARQRFYERFNPLSLALRRLLRRQLASAAREFENRGRLLKPRISSLEKGA